MFRHGFGTSHIINKTPLEQIKKMMGHERYDTTLIYADIPDKHLKESIDKVTTQQKTIIKKMLDKLGISLKKETKININFYKDKFLIGRDLEIKKLSENFEKGINTLILGKIGIGKSHLLEYIESEKKVLRIDDLVGIKTTLINLLTHLYDNDKKHVKQLLYDDIDSDKLNVKLSRTSVRNLTKEICDLVQNKEYILIIDSVDRISPNGVKFLELIKDHFVIICSARSVKIDRSSAFWNFDKLELKELSRTKSIEMISKLSRDLEIENYELYRNHIFEQTNGNPRAIFEIIDRYRKENIITNEVVREIRHTSSLKEIDMTFIIFIAFALMYVLRYLSKEIDNDGYKFIGGIALVMTLIFRQFATKYTRKYL